MKLDEQRPFSVLLYYYPFCKFFFCCLISELLININRPGHRGGGGGNQELSEELPVHINQMLIYSSYVQLLLKVLRRGRARKNLESSQS